VDAVLWMVATESIGQEMDHRARQRTVVNLLESDTDGGSVADCSQPPVTVAPHVHVQNRAQPGYNSTLHTA
jgi:hypothetical protein